MTDSFSFANYDVNSLKEEYNPALIKNLEQTNPAMTKERAKKESFLQINDIDDIDEKVSTPTERPNDPVAIPYDNNFSNSYLSLVLSPNLKELELMIRGLEYVKVFDNRTNRERIILRKIAGHPLNEYGINQILTHIKIYASPEIKLGRKIEKAYYHSIQQVGKTITRLIYKNLKSFGMDTQEKQRHAKPFCLAIIEIIDSSFSRSIGGKENDLSRATNFNVNANIEDYSDTTRIFNPIKKEQMKN